ncbi:MAG TPA: hypothetical protein VN108_08970, partial [Marmoricola sp.]|nr:hypothetical protein [Marmoricola sp.]
MRGQPIEWLRRWPFAISIAALVITVTVGVTLKGPEFVARPLPLPPWVAVYWLTINGVLSLIA